MRALVAMLFMLVACGSSPRAVHSEKQKIFKLKVGVSYYVKVTGNEGTVGEYLGRRLINGKPYLLFRGIHPFCKGQDGCWNKRNIAEGQIIEITPERDDLTCERLWCTD